eukprot:gene1364-1965_t
MEEEAGMVEEAEEVAVAEVGVAKVVVAKAAAAKVVVVKAAVAKGVEAKAVEERKLGPDDVLNEILSTPVLENVVRTQVKLEFSCK